MALFPLPAAKAVLAVLAMAVVGLAGWVLLDVMVVVRLARCC